MKLRVFKFGGTSLANPEALQKVFAIIESHAQGLCVVVSAASGVTDSLYKLYQKSVKSLSAETLPIISQIESFHLELVDSLLPVGLARSHLESRVRKFVEDLRRISESLSVLREETPKTLSMTVCHGERIMASIVCEALNEMGCHSSLVDPTKLIKLDCQNQDYIPNDERSRQASLAEAIPLLNQGKVVVVPGFFGEGPDGEQMILGRGGSDYSATLLGSYLGAQEVCLYKDVEGLMTADPRHVYEARVLPELHYREAAELAYYGAKVLHPRAIIPLVQQQIPLVVRCTFLPEKLGTRIHSQVSESDFPVKALSYIDRQAMISIEGKGMMGVPGLASRAFGAMGQNSISISFITQASSEASICFVVPGDQGSLARRVLEDVFRFELDHHLIDEIKFTNDLAILAVVGLGMKGVPGIAARAFQCIANEKINVVAIAQGSSELNISIVIDQIDAARALRALHKEYGLEKIRAVSYRDPREINLCIYGFGQIGQALVRQLREQKIYLEKKLKLNTRIGALCDRSGLVLNESGFSENHLDAFLKLKSTKMPLNEHAKGQDSKAELEVGLWNLAWDRKIFIDLTASESAEVLRRALLSGFHVVLANKKPLAIPYKEYREIMNLAADKNLQFRYEATVGAGLPVLDTIEKLLMTGDRVEEILGCFSGTLGYLMTEMEDGISFSGAVKKAFEMGYTEPDPRDDLSGLDVARKALILARTIGIELDLTDLVLDPLFPEALSCDEPHKFIENLKHLDDEYSVRLQKAKERDNTLRYVARISREKVSVGIEEVARNSPLGRLRGTDNQVSIRSLRYSNNPLVVTGPGAGAEVTAGGVLNDIMTISLHQERGK